MYAPSTPLHPGYRGTFRTLEPPALFEAREAMCERSLQSLISRAPPLCTRRCNTFHASSLSDIMGLSTLFNLPASLRRLPCRTTSPGTCPQHTQPCYHRSFPHFTTVPSLSLDIMGFSTFFNLPASLRWPPCYTTSPATRPQRLQRYHSLVIPLFHNYPLSIPGDGRS